MKIIVRLYGRRVRDAPVQKFILATEGADKTPEDFYAVLRMLQDSIPFKDLLRYERGATGSITFTAFNERLTLEVVKTIKDVVEDVLAKI